MSYPVDTGWVYEYPDAAGKSQYLVFSKAKSACWFAMEKRITDYLQIYPALDCLTVPVQ